MRSYRDKIKSAINQRNWYWRQKASNNGFEGYVYAIITDETNETYVGSTTNSLKKRLHQHRGGSNCRTNGYRHEITELILLEEVPLGEDLIAAEISWITFINPSINKHYAEMSFANSPHCYKGGVTFGDTWYPTKKALWETLGEVPYGTFKTRLHRGKSLEDSLRIL